MQEGIMERVVRGWVVALVALTGCLAAVASGLGIFLRGDLATQVFRTVRGEEAEILTGGIYRFNGEAVAAEGVGWDIVTLFIVVPAFLLALPALRRGSVRALLFATGVLAYFLYQYAEYAMFLAFGPLFPIYVAIFALSLSGIAILLSHLDLAALAGGVDDRFPRRGAAAFGAFMAILLAGMWLPLIARRVGQTVVPELDGATTLVVQAFDLGFLVPVGIFTAVTVWRRLPVGFILAAVVVVKGAAMGAGIAAMLVVEYLVTGVLQIVPIVLFASVSLVCVALGVRVFGSIGGSARTARTPAMGRMTRRTTTG
jgi:hypothetical protein